MKTLTICRIATAVLACADVCSAQSYLLDKFIKVQPIFVADDSGNNGVSPALLTAQFKDATQAIWAQAGIKVIWESDHSFNNTGFLYIDGVGYGDVLEELQTLAPQNGSTAHGQNSDTTVMNMWFVKSAGGGYGFSLQSKVKGAFGLTLQNGMSISESVLTSGRLDTIAHEMGHNLGLDHLTFGSGAANNLMTDGGSRSTPSSIFDIEPLGARLDRLDGTDGTTTQIALVRSIQTVFPAESFLKNLVPTETYTPVPEPQAAAAVVAVALVGWTMVRRSRGLKQETSV